MSVVLIKFQINKWLLLHLSNFDVISNSILDLVFQLLIYSIPISKLYPICLQMKPPSAYIQYLFYLSLFSNCYNFWTGATATTERISRPHRPHAPRGRKSTPEMLSAVRCALSELQGDTAPLSTSKKSSRTTEFNSTCG